MSDISDELRRLAHDEGVYGDACVGLRDLADRIDSELMELLRDRDGVPIHVGDTVWGCISGTQMAVHKLGLTDRWTISTDTGFIPKASAVTHARPDSFERIADELEEWSEDNRVNGSGEVFDRARGFSDRIRKLAKSGDKR